MCFFFLLLVFCPFFVTNSDTCCFAARMMDSPSNLSPFSQSNETLSFDATTILSLDLQKLKESSQNIQDKIESFCNQRCKKRKEENKEIQGNVSTLNEAPFDPFRTTNAALESLWKFEVVFLNLQQKLFSLIKKGDEVSFFQKREELGKVPKSLSEPLYCGKVFSSNLQNQTLILASTQNQKVKNINIDEQSASLTKMAKIFFYQVVSIRFASQCDEERVEKKPTKPEKILMKERKNKKKRMLSSCFGRKRNKIKSRKAPSFVFKNNQNLEKVQDTKMKKGNDMEKLEIFDLVQYLGPGLHFQEFAEIVSFLKVTVKIRFLSNQEEKNVKLKFLHKIS